MSVSSNCIFNVDETGILIVFDPPWCCSKKDKTSWPGSLSWTETNDYYYNNGATGKVVPPVFIFPRARLTDNLMMYAPYKAV